MGATQREEHEKSKQIIYAKALLLYTLVTWWLGDPSEPIFLVPFLTILPFYFVHLFFLKIKDP